MSSFNWAIVCSGPTVFSVTGDIPELSTWISHKSGISSPDAEEETSHYFPKKIRNN